MRCNKCFTEIKQEEKTNKGCFYCNKWEWISISDLIPNEKNPRSMTRAEMNKLVRSIKEFGFRNPIIVNINKERYLRIIAGHQRVEACKRIGMKQIPYYSVNLSYEKESLLNIADNEIQGSWDDKKLFDLLKELGEKDVDISLTGFDEPFIDEILRSNEDSEKNALIDIIPEVPKKVKCMRGDIFILDKHRVMCGDATDKEDVDKLMGGIKADLVFCDPPYNVNYSSKNELLNLYDKGNRIQTPLKNHFLTEQEYEKFNDLWFSNVLEVLNDYNSVYICGNYESLISLYKIKAFIISNILVWVKNSIILGRMDYKGQHENILYGWKKHHKWYGDNSQSTIWNVNKNLKNDLHPTQKPIDLVIKAIKNSSTYGNIVLDVFGGSGSTIIACEKTNRVCYMMEISPEYCDVIISRWAVFTGKEPVRISDNKKWSAINGRK